MKPTRMHASLAGAGLLTCAMVALAQNPPPANPPADHNPADAKPRQPAQPPTARPSADARVGYMETPRYAQKLDTTLSENAIQLCAENDFKGASHTAEMINKSHQSGTLNPFPGEFDNAVTSLRWNLAPGVLVVFFDEGDGKGGQLALWGKGQIPDLGKCDFKEQASRWSWYDVGGGNTPRSAGDIALPHHATVPTNTLAAGSLQFFDDQNFTKDEQKVTGITGMKAGDQHVMPGMENTASSIRWSLPDGVVAILAAEDGGNDNLVLFGEAQFADLGVVAFDNKASRWSWAYIGTNPKAAKDVPPREP